MRSDSLEHKRPPNGSTVSKTDVVNVERLGDDDAVNHLCRNVALLDEPAGAGVAHACRLLIDAAGVLDSAL